MLHETKLSHAHPVASSLGSGVLTRSSRFILPYVCDWFMAKSGSEGRCSTLLEYWFSCQPASTLYDTYLVFLETVHNFSFPSTSSSLAFPLLNMQVWSTSDLRETDLRSNQPQRSRGSRRETRTVEVAYKPSKFLSIHGQSTFYQGCNGFRNSTSSGRKSNH